MSNKKIFAGLATVALSASLAVVAAVPASAATASCQATNATSSLSHTVSENPSDTCYRVQARAQHYYSSGANETAYGPEHASNSTVYASPGVSIGSWAGRARPVAAPGPWATYQPFTTSSTTKTFTVNF